MVFNFQSWLGWRLDKELARAVILEFVIIQTYLRIQSPRCVWFYIGAREPHAFKKSVASIEKIESASDIVRAFAEA